MSDTFGWEGLVRAAGATALKEWEQLSEHDPLPDFNRAGRTFLREVLAPSAPASLSRRQVRSDQLQLLSAGFVAGAAVGWLLKR